MIGDDPDGKPEFGTEDARKSISSISLISFLLGDFLVVMKSTPDVIISDEPYLSLMLFVEMKSGIYIKRIWNRTVARGKAVTIEQLIDLCRKHFFRGKPCIGCPQNLDQVDGLDFVICQTPIPRKVSRYCLEMLDTDVGQDENTCAECMKLSAVNEDQSPLDLGAKCEALSRSKMEERHGICMSESAIDYSDNLDTKYENMMPECNSQEEGYFPMEPDESQQSNIPQELASTVKDEKNLCSTGQPGQNSQPSEDVEQYGCQVCKSIFKDIS